MPKLVRKPRATITQVAHATGLSLATVSRAFAGDPAVRLATRERVVAAARELGYRPNASARSLKQGSTGAIGILSEAGPWIFYSTFHGLLLQGLALAMGADGRRMVFYFPEIEHSADALPAHDRIRVRGTEALADGWVDGALIMGSEISDPKTLQQLKKEGFPLVLVGPDRPLPGFVQLGSGLAHRIQLGLDLLASAGHRQVAYVGLARKSLHNEVVRKELESGARRLKLNFDPADLFEHATYELLNPVELRLFADAVLARGITAVLVATAEQAAQLRDILEAKGRRVPQDVSLLCYGQPPWTLRAHPRPLSVISADLNDEGVRAYGLVKALLEGASPKSLEIMWSLERDGATLAPPPKPQK